MPESFFGPLQFVGHLADVRTAQVLQFAAFEQVPDSFLRVEFRHVSWQALQLEEFASASFEKVLDGLCAMDRRAIPEKRSWKTTKSLSYICRWGGSVLYSHEAAPQSIVRLKGLTAIYGMGTGRTSVNKLAPLLLTTKNTIIFRYARRSCQIAGIVSRSHPSKFGAKILCLFTTESVASSSESSPRTR